MLYYDKIQRTVKTYDSGMSLAMNSHIAVGPFYLSIQASEHHYSRPRKTFPTMDDYEAVEVGILDEDSQWFPVHSSRFKDRFWAKYFNEQDGAIAPYMPVEAVEAMIKELVQEQTA